ncbi:cytochrome c biogenesis protein DipZ [bacterium]|nr:cytochrome c biogenesis protein DipZ [bacterium]
MFLLIIYSFIAGLVTILSPCVLPLLPIILSSAVEGDKSSQRKPFGIILGFILSFTFFTLFLSSLVRLTNISADTLRLISVFIIAGFGLSLVIPKFQLVTEKFFSKLSSKGLSSKDKTGFGGGFLIGISLGLLWTPCVGPIFASVITLAAIGVFNTSVLFITLSYSLGTAFPMLMIMLGGSKVTSKIPLLNRNLVNIQKAFGVLMILLAIGIYTGVDRKFQNYLLSAFPNWGAGLTRFEDTSVIDKSLQNINKNTKSSNSIFDVPLPKINNSPLNVKNPIFAPDLIVGGIWFNSEPLSMSQLKGKIVLIDFWTYTCINCQRTLPYLKTWWEKYEKEGLVIIGVHTPEFEFEKNPKNVLQALEDFGINYPVMQDNDFATWRAYNNRYWPAKYLIDKEGNIRYYHFGEGDYDKTEKAIQELLKVEQSISTELAPKSYAKTPETYLGYGRLKGFASNESIKEDVLETYSLPRDLKGNSFAYEGNWVVNEEFANPEAGAKLYFNFDAQQVFLVMRAKEGNSKVKVLLKNNPNDLGLDVVGGFVTVTKDTLYKLVKLKNAGKETLILEFEDNNVEVFAFTFG